MSTLMHNINCIIFAADGLNYQNRLSLKVGKSKHVTDKLKYTIDQMIKVKWKIISFHHAHACGSIVLYQVLPE